MTHRYFRTLITTTCLAALISVGATVALAQDTSAVPLAPPPMPSLPPMPEPLAVPKGMAMPPVPLPVTQKATPPLPAQGVSPLAEDKKIPMVMEAPTTQVLEDPMDDFVPEEPTFDDEFAPTGSDAPTAEVIPEKEPADAITGMKNPADPLSENEVDSAEIEALLQEMETPVGIAEEAVPEMIPALEAPAVPVAEVMEEPAAPLEDVVAEDAIELDMTAAPEPENTEAAAAEDETPPPALPVSTTDGQEEDISTMTQAQIDAELNAMMKEIQESEDESADTEDSPKRVVKPVRVPDFLYNKNPDKTNEHLYPVYTPEDLDKLLMKEAREGNLNAVQALLLEGRDINHQSPKGNTPLIEAIRAGQKHMVRMLLMRGADANLANHTGQTPMHFAAIRGDIAIMQALLDAGANISPGDQNNTTPLHLATMAQKDDAVRLLVLKGATLDAANSSGQTALHVAAAKNNMRAAETLLAAHANPKLTTNSGLTPAAIAQQKGYNQMAQRLNKGSRGVPDGDIMVAERDAAGNVQWSAPPAATDDAEVGMPGSDKLRVGKWYRDKESWKLTWFKHGAVRPQIGESPYAQEGWKYSQDKYGNWWVFDGEHVKYSTISEEEQKRWNTLLNGWIEANAAFEKLTLPQKVEWNEKLKLLQVVFTTHFNSPTADGQAYINEALSKWQALDAPAVPAEPISVAEVSVPDQAVANAEAAPVVAASATTETAPVVPQTPLEQAIVSTPKSMQAPAEQVAAATTTAVATEMTSPSLSAPSVEAAKAADAAAITPPPLPKVEIVPAPVVTAVVPSATQALSTKVMEQAALSGAAVTPNVEKQLEVLQMIGEWETVDESRATLQPAQRVEANKLRQEIAAKVVPGGSHAEAFVVMPEKLKQQFAQSMKTWDMAEATHTPLPEYYSTGYAPSTPKVYEAPAAAPKPSDDGLPMSMRWAREHKDIIPLWLKEGLHKIAAARTPEYTAPASVPVYVAPVYTAPTAPVAPEVKPYMLEAEPYNNTLPIQLNRALQVQPVPMPAAPVMPTPQPPAQLPSQGQADMVPLDARTATPEQIEAMRRATEEMQRAIKAQESLRGLLAPQ